MYNNFVVAHLLKDWLKDWLKVCELTGRYQFNIYRIALKFDINCIIVKHLLEYVYGNEHTYHIMRYVFNEYNYTLITNLIAANDRNKTRQMKKQKEL